MKELKTLLSSYVPISTADDLQWLMQKWSTDNRSEAIRRCIKLAKAIEEKAEGSKTS